MLINHMEITDGSSYGLYQLHEFLLFRLVSGFIGF